MDGPAFQVAAVMRLVDMVSGPLRFVRNAMGDTERSAASLSARMGNLAKKMAPAAIAAGVFLAGLGSSISTAAGFEAAISGVGAVSNASVSEMRLLGQAALDLGSSTAWSASQVAEAEKYLAMAGFKVQENIAALPGVLNMASAGATDLGRAADISSDILSAFSLRAAEMPRVADVLTKTFTTANTSLELLGDTMKYVAPVAKTAGMSLEEAAAMAGLLGNVGIKGSQAGTTLRAMINRLAAPTSEATKAFQSLGITSDFLAENLSHPTAILGEMASRMEGMGAARQLGILKKIFDTEAMAGVAKLIEQEGIGGITKYLDVIKNSHGAAAAVAERQLDNLKGAVTILGSAWEGLQITIGKVFLPVLTVVTRGIATAVGWLGKLAGTKVGQFLVGSAAAVSVGAIALTVFAAASWAASMALPALTAQLAPLAAMIAGISWPVWLVIAAVGALYVAWRANFGGLHDIVAGFLDKVGLVYRGVREILASLQGTVGELSGELSGKLQAAGLLGLVQGIARVVYRVAGFLSELWRGFSFVGAQVGEVFKPVIESLVFALQPLWEIVRAVAVALFGATAATDASPWRTLGQVIGVVVGSAFKMLAWAVRLALVPLELASWLIGGVLRLIVGLVKVFSGAAGAVTGFFETFNLFESGAKLIDTFVAGIKSRIMAPVELVRSGLAKLRNLLPFSDAKEGPLSQLTLSGRRIMDTLGAGIRAAAPGLHKLMGSALTGVALTTAVVAGGQVPVPGLRPTPEQKASATGSGKVVARAGTRQTKIIIQRLELPGVSDARGFVDALQRLVEEYDG